MKRQTQQLEKTENPSTAGYLLRENHILKPHDSSIIKKNLNQMEQVETFVQGIKDKVKSDLLSSVLANGKIKAGRRTSYKFDEDVIFELRQLKEKLVSTRPKLTDLGRKASNLFQVGFGAFKRNSRSKKQNKHRAAKRKAMRTSQRTAEVIKKIAPGLDKDSRCEKKVI